MKLSTIAAVALTISTLSFAADAEVKEATDVETINTGKGFYLGAGLGVSSYNISSSDGEYITYNDGSITDAVKVNDFDNLDDTDMGYLLYGGYQFNKIIGVEASFTDYGAFSGNINTDSFTKDPYAIAVAANAGYAFFNAQLRPFGLLGLGYMDTKQSQAYDRLDVSNSFPTIHWGVGVDYYPTVLQGFGVRASYSGDSYFDNDYEVSENVDGSSTINSNSLWQYYGLLYVGVQYKF